MNFHYDPQLEDEPEQDNEHATGILSRVIQLTQNVNSELLTLIHHIEQLSRQNNVSMNVLIKKLYDSLDKTITSFYEEANTFAAARKQATYQQMINTILDKHYPIEVRFEMLKAHDQEDMNAIKEIALEYDKDHRDRPYKGQTGPDDPLSIAQSKLEHIDFDKLLRAGRGCGRKRVLPKRCEEHESD